MRYKLNPHEDTELVCLQIEDTRVQTLSKTTPISELMEFWGVETLNVHIVHCRTTLDFGGKRPEVEPEVCRTNFGTWEKLNSEWVYCLYRQPFYRINGNKHWTIAQAEALLNEKGAFAFAEKYLPFELRHDVYLAKAYQRFLATRQPQWTCNPIRTNVIYSLVDLKLDFHFVCDIPIRISDEDEPYTLTEHHIQMQGVYYIVEVYSDAAQPRYYNTVLNEKGYLKKGALIARPPKGVKLQVAKTPHYN